jgi:hypothetical protein
MINHRDHSEFGWNKTPAWVMTLLQNMILDFHSTIREEFLSRINQIFYLGLFCTTHEHYNYLQLKQSLMKWNYLQKMVKEPA